MGAAKAILLAWNTIWQLHGYLLRVTGLFQEVLSICAFGSFILSYDENLDSRKQFLDFYHKALKAYSYYCLVPCLAKLYGDEIDRTPGLRSFFKEMPLYQRSRAAVLYEDEIDKDIPETIATAFNDIMGPIAHLTWRALGSIFVWLGDYLDGFAAVIYTWAKKRDFNLEVLVNSVIQAYEEKQSKIRIRNIPKDIYLAQRPTLPFDWATLKAHIMTYYAYRAMYDRHRKQRQGGRLPWGVQATITWGDDLVTRKNLETNGRIYFCLLNEKMDEKVGEPLNVEVT